MHTLIGTHNPALVVLSVLIAIAASYTALDLANRMRATRGVPRAAWLATAALAMGGGIWAMHFVGMLSYALPGLQIRYNLELTLLSLLVPVVVTAVGFRSVRKGSRTLRTILPGGLLMGLGIGAMHYIGMAALETGATLVYDPVWVVISFCIAIGAATAALALAMSQTRLAVRLAAAVVMGLAIAGMHYAGMHAASFALPAGDAPAADLQGLGHIALAFAVIGSTFLILTLALIAAMYDRRLALLARRETEFFKVNEERFRRLYSRSPLALHSLNAEGIIEYVSESWLRMLGFSREEVVGSRLTRFIPQAPLGEALLVAVNAARDGVFEHEYRIRTGRGDMLDVVLSSRVERDADGAVTAVLGGLTNVTERRLAEQALMQSQKMEAIGKLTGGVAHDFNNLLAVVVGNLELLRKRVGDDQKARMLVENALSGAQRGTSLTQRMLAFARKQDLRPEAVCLPEVIKSLRPLLQRSVGPSIQLSMRFHQELPMAYVDAHQLELVLLNLVVNARDAMPEGGTVDILVEPIEFEQTQSINKATGIIRLVVQDSGVGMDEETLARATEPFFTTKGIGKGTGLGLSMAQGLAEQSGGRLLMSSQMGVGTRVELWLPVSTSEQSRQTREPATQVMEAPEQRAPLTILVVDDDSLVLVNTVAVLEDLGHQPISALSGADALKLLRSGIRVDMLVTDEAMPLMSGSQLADTVRGERPGMPILIVSGYRELSEEAQNRYTRLNKPFTQQQLKQAMRSVLSASQNSIEPPFQGDLLDTDSHLR